MSENVQPQNNSEEIDILVLFDYVGKRINNLFIFIFKLFRYVYSGFIYLLKPIVNNFKLIIIVMLVAGVIGYIIEANKTSVYNSSMLVRPYFESKYQLVTNISYYNSLLENSDYETLSSIFEISTEEAEEIVGFEISPGPETENDRIVQYDNFVKSIDSIRAQEISFEDYVENRSIYSGDLFEIQAFSLKKDIFTRLEDGLNNAFTNDYSIKKMLKRDSLITIQKNNILEQLSQVDSLQKIYIRVLEEESKSKSTEFSLGGEGFSLSKDKSNTREFDLLEKEISLRNSLKELDEKKVDEDVFFDVISSFPLVGKKTTKWEDRFSLIFPFLAFALLAFTYIIKKFFVYIKNYEA